MKQNVCWLFDNSMHTFEGKHETKKGIKKTPKINEKIVIFFFAFHPKKKSESVQSESESLSLTCTIILWIEPLLKSNWLPNN